MTKPGTLLKWNVDSEYKNHDPYGNYRYEGIILNPRHTIGLKVRTADGKWANCHPPNGVNLKGAFGVRYWVDRDEWPALDAMVDLSEDNDDNDENVDEYAIIDKNGEEFDFYEILKYHAVSFVDVVKRDNSVKGVVLCYEDGWHEEVAPQIFTMFKQFNKSQDAYKVDHEWKEVLRHAPMPTGYEMVDISIKDMPVIGRYMVAEIKKHSL